MPKEEKPIAAIIFWSSSAAVVGSSEGGGFSEGFAGGFGGVGGVGGIVGGILLWWWGRVVLGKMERVGADGDGGLGREEGVDLEWRCEWWSLVEWSIDNPYRYG